MVSAARWLPNPGVICLPADGKKGAKDFASDAKKSFTLGLGVLSKVFAASFTLQLPL
jgi:hypothetical protein